MSNENCLAGMRCPKCGSYGSFGISVSGWADACTDDGIDCVGDIEWDDDSACQCKECKHTDIVGNFDEDLCEIKEESDEKSAGV